MGQEPNLIPPPEKNANGARFENRKLEYQFRSTAH